jgi:hypothetical protein
MPKSSVATPKIDFGIPKSNDLRGWKSPTHSTLSALRASYWFSA